MTDASLFYRRFEDRYRGSRDLILGRLRGYAPYLETLKARHGGNPSALDLGCGRGEWLEVLDEAGFEARGVDLDPGMLSACEERGLKVECEDATTALQSCEDGSLVLISGFHIAEHLEFDVLRALISEAYRSLASDGMLILETPNPENLRVMAVDYYMDPTHQNPLPPRLLTFAVEFCGFSPCHVLRLQEPSAAHDAPFPSFSEIYNNASPDYAVMAGKGWSDAVAERIQAIADRHAGVTAEALMERRDAAQHNQRQRIDRRIDELADQGERIWQAVERQLESINTGLDHQQKLHGQLSGHIEKLQNREGRHWQAVEQHLASLNTRLDHQQQLQVQLSGCIDELADQGERHWQTVEQHLVSLDARLDQREALEEQLDAVYASRSWRITAPLRAVSGFVRGLKDITAALPLSIVRRVLQSGRLRAFLYEHPRTNRLLRKAIGVSGLEQRLRQIASHRPVAPERSNGEATPGMARHAQHVLRRLNDERE